MPTAVTVSRIAFCAVFLAGVGCGSLDVKVVFAIGDVLGGMTSLPVFGSCCSGGAVAELRETESCTGEGADGEEGERHGYCVNVLRPRNG